MTSARRDGNPVDRVRAIERAFIVLGRLAVGPAGLSEIAESTGLAKSTVLRILSTLEHVDAVQRDHAGHYLVGDGIEELVRFRDSSASLMVTVRPHLATLSAEVGEAAGFGVRVGEMVHHLVQTGPDTAVQVKDYTGHSVPLHVSPSGVVILSHMDTDEIETYLRTTLASYTDRTVTDPGAIRDRLDRTRAEGHTWSLAEFADDLNSVAAPSFAADGSLLGAVGVHGPAYRFPADRRAAITEAVIAAAARLTDAMSRSHSPSIPGPPSSAMG